MGATMQQPAAVKLQLAAVDCLQRLLHVAATAQQPATAERQLAAVEGLQRLTLVVATAQLPAAAERQHLAGALLYQLPQVILGSPACSEVSDCSGLQLAREGRLQSFRWLLADGSWSRWHGTLNHAKSGFGGEIGSEGGGGPPRRSREPAGDSW